MTLSWSDRHVRAAVRATVQGVQRHLAARVGSHASVEDLEPDRVAELIADEVRTLRADDVVLPAGLTGREQAEIWDTTRTAAFAELVGLGRLQPLLDDDTTQDVHINGHDAVFVTDTTGHSRQLDSVADSDADLVELGRRLARRHDGPEGEQDWSRTSPVAEFTLQSGHRIELVHQPVAVRPSITIRRPDPTLRRVAQLEALGTLHEQVAGFLSAATKAGANILVAGGTGAGKTTTLRALINEIPPDERVITMEDTRELLITHEVMVDDDGQPLHPNAVELITQKGNADGAGIFSLSDAIKASKRMDPNRLIVGEVRADEAYWMIDAMQGEAGGSLCTIHASNPRAAVNRLITLIVGHIHLNEFSAVRMIADSVNVIAYQRKDPSTGKRYVSEVAIVDGQEDGVIQLHHAYQVDAHGRLLVSTGPTRTMQDSHGWTPSMLQVVE